MTTLKIHYIDSRYSGSMLTVFFDGSEPVLFVNTDEVKDTSRMAEILLLAQTDIQLRYADSKLRRR